MNKKDIIQLDGGGWVYGILPKGCDMCLKGMKMVFFMGGDCPSPSHCRWYCPLSAERRSKDAYFADEIPINNPEKLENCIITLIDEAKKIEAGGMSFTGGDPLQTAVKIDSVIKIIERLKGEFGEKFHIHLYSSGDNLDSLTAEKLGTAGLDELRLHPSESNFHRIEFAADKGYEFGAEVPIIPTTEYYSYILKLVDYLTSIGANFLNLNEFEMCGSNNDSLIQKGFKLRESSIAAVEGSEEYADKFLHDFTPRGDLSIHYCPVVVKDGTQLRNRYIRRANHIKRPYEDVTEDGCLMFLRIEGDNKQLNELYNELIDQSGMPSKLLNLSKEDQKLDLPWGLGKDKNFIELLNQFQLNSGIIKTTPFHNEPGYQICEYQPILKKKISRIHKG